jgi:hypothetical protein
MFGREGVSRAVRAKVAPNIVWSARALRGDGFLLLLAHIEEGGDRAGLWRTALRLVKLGEPRRAARLALALAAA